MQTVCRPSEKRRGDGSLQRGTSAGAVGGRRQGGKGTRGKVQEPGGAAAGAGAGGAEGGALGGTFKIQLITSVIACNLVFLVYLTDDK